VTIKLNQPIKANLETLTQYLAQVNDSGWYTNFGPLHQQLTKRLEEHLGVENLLLVSNGTLALQVAYKTLNVRSALTTPFSFVATTSSLIWQDIDVSFSDIDEASYNLCPIQAELALEQDSNIDTIVATHVYGNPCDVGNFAQIAAKKNINIIYDAAHAFDVDIGDKSVLNFGDASTLSFHATKVFHTVEGGAVIFKRKADYERAKRLINFGIDENGHINEAGINAKLNEYQCAVGLTLLDQVSEVRQHRAELFQAYYDALCDIVELPVWHAGASFNGAYMPIDLGRASIVTIVEQALHENNIQCRRYFKPSLDQVFTEQKAYDCTNSQKLSQRILCLPLHYYMTLEDVMIIIKVISNALKGTKDD
jgi:dTDP-4-amino-4,6-dideoxygalactose transaminase